MAVTLPFKGNFRSTSAYVTDGAGETGIISAADVSTGAAVQYNATPGYGWVASNAGTRDRSNTIPQVAGIHFNEVNTTDSFRVDLPSTGQYTVKFLSGDVANNAATKVELFDNASSLGSAITGSPTAGNFLDATGATISAANWNTGAAVTVTMTTTTLIFKVGDGVSSNTGFLAHVEVAAVAAAGTPTKPMWPMSFF